QAAAFQRRSVKEQFLRPGAFPPQGKCPQKKKSFLARAPEGRTSMLSRTADHLYWMARYTERAENLARMLDVNSRMSLLPQGAEVVERGWIATLTINGLMDAFRQRYDTV